MCVCVQLKGTYRVVYGKWLTLLFVCATVAVGVVSSYLVGLHWMLWPLQALMIAVSRHIQPALSLSMYDAFLLYKVSVNN